MNIKNNDIGNKQEGMCKGCMLFYGAEAYQGLCSSCYKLNQPQKKQQIVTKTIEAQIPLLAVCRKDTIDTVQEIPQQHPQNDRKRCFNCNKKVGLLGIECKCGFIYCNGHRLPENHQCIYNHAEVGKKKLQKQVIKVYNGKIADI